MEERSGSGSQSGTGTVASFTKILKRTHVKARRLDFPTRFLKFLPLEFDHHAGQRLRRVTFQVRYGNEPHLRTFHCLVRKGPYPKPAICRGWSQLVDDKSLRAGDRLIFYVDQEEQQAPHFRILALRRPSITLFGATIGLGSTWDPLLP